MSKSKESDQTTNEMIKKNIIEITPTIDKKSQIIIQGVNKCSINNTNNEFQNNFNSKWLSSNKNYSDMQIDEEENKVLNIEVKTNSPILKNSSPLFIKNDSFDEQYKNVFQIKNKNNIFEDKDNSFLLQENNGNCYKEYEILQNDYLILEEIFKNIYAETNSINTFKNSK